MSQKLTVLSVNRYDEKSLDDEKSLGPEKSALTASTRVLAAQY